MIALIENELQLFHWSLYSVCSSSKKCIYKILKQKLKHFQCYRTQEVHSIKIDFKGISEKQNIFQINFLFVTMAMFGFQQSNISFNELL
jgi:hypothetical protein